MRSGLASLIEEDAPGTVQAEQGEEALLSHVDGWKNVGHSASGEAGQRTRYGRATIPFQEFVASDRVFDIVPSRTNWPYDKVFVDLGSAFGEFSMRVNLGTQVGTHALELISGRHQTAERLRTHLLVHMQRSPNLARPFMSLSGGVFFYNGSLQKQQVINGVMDNVGDHKAMIFFNNFKDTTTAINDGRMEPTLDDSAAAFLGMCRKGSALLSLQPICALDSIRPDRAFTRKEEVTFDGPIMTHQTARSVKEGTKVYLYKKHRPKYWKVSCRNRKCKNRNYELVRAAGNEGLLTVEDACPDCGHRGPRSSGRSKAH